MFKSEHCSPDNKDTKHSCLNLKMLKQIAKALNKHNKNGGVGKKRIKLTYNS